MALPMDGRDEPEQFDFDFYWHVYNAIAGWVRFSDAKAAGVIAANALLWSVMVKVSGMNVAYSNRGEMTLFAGVGLLFALLSAASVGLALLSVLPTLRVDEARSYVYFAHIARRVSDGMTPEECKHARDSWVQEFLILDSASKARQIGQQVWANARVAWKKYQLVSWSVRCLIAALATVVILGVLYSF